MLSASDLEREQKALSLMIFFSELFKVCEFVSFLYNLGNYHYYQTGSRIQPLQNFQFPCLLWHFISTTRYKFK